MLEVVSCGGDILLPLVLKLGSFITAQSHDQKRLHKAKIKFKILNCLITLETSSMSAIHYRKKQKQVLKSWRERGVTWMCNGSTVLLGHCNVMWLSLKELHVQIHMTQTEFWILAKGNDSFIEIRSLDFCVYLLIP